LRKFNTFLVCFSLQYLHWKACRIWLKDIWKEDFVCDTYFLQGWWIYLDSDYVHTRVPYTSGISHAHITARLSKPSVITSVEVLRIRDTLVQIRIRLQLFLSVADKMPTKRFFSYCFYCIYISLRIRILIFTHPGSRIQWSKRHWIPDPVPQHC
jgi:hypothetical protein